MSTRLPDDNGFPAGADENPRYLGELDIRIGRDGSWYYNGSPVERQEMVCLFASMLTRGDDGGYWLISPDEIGRIEVDDAPFVAVELYVSGRGKAQKLSLRTNVDEVVTLDAEQPLIVKPSPATNQNTPYVILHDMIEARIGRAVYMELVALGVEDLSNGASELGVWSQGLFFPLTGIGEPAA